ncbi:MAG: class I SAM-dependent methyltransferase, partial [Chloroflexi bacterium]
MDCAPLEGGPDVEWFGGLARRTGGPILELGCGTGRITVPVAQDGHHVVGLDRSA